MKIRKDLRVLSVSEAYKALELAVADIVKRAVWYSPYNVAGPQYRSTIRELKKPLAELHLAQRRERDIEEGE